MTQSYLTNQTTPDDLDQTLEGAPVHGSVINQSQIDQSQVNVSPTDHDDVTDDGIIRPNSRGDGPRRSSLNTSGPVTSEATGPRGNPTRVFPRQTKSATTNSQVENSLKRQKTKVLQSVNSRQGPRTDQNQESLHLNQSKASITITGQAANQSAALSSAVFRPKSAQLPQVSMSVMTDIENEPEVTGSDKGKFPKQNRTYSTAHSEASMGDDFEEKTPQQLLIHPSGLVSLTFQSPPALQKDSHLYESGWS